MRASVGIIGYGLLLSRCNDGATKTCLLGVNAVVVDVVVAVEVGVDVVEVVVLVVVVLLRKNGGHLKKTHFKTLIN